MIKIHILEAAQKELDEAVEYYNELKKHLGFEFADEVERTLVGIAEFPYAWHPYSAKTRRHRLKRFPYGIIYQIKDNELLVIAIANHRRAPLYWIDRLWES